ncbi:glycosyltransferase [Streptomyces sp. GC420]|nr:glycosyltransferase [Streptomyces sp. GC420]
MVPTTGQRINYLRVCLESIMTQPQAIDVVIVGPAAATAPLAEIASEYGCRFIPERTSGLSNAINQGWEESVADYLGWLGDDDVLADGAISAAIEELEGNSDAAMVYGRVKVIDSEGNHIYTMRPGKAASRVLKYGVNLVWQPGSLYRERAVRRAGLLDPSLRYVMDFDLHLRLSQHGTLSYVPRILASYRYHPTSLTATNADPHGERLTVMRRYLSRRAQMLEGCWWPVAKCVGRVWGSLQILSSPRP